MDVSEKDGGGLRLSDLAVTKWLGGELKPGRVTAVHAFQMLCPGCIYHGLPQTQRLHAAFSDEHVQVVGLHTVFEHHDAMTETALKAFLSELRLRIPVGIDQPAPDGSSIPVSMRKFSLQGTPSWLLFDRNGKLQIHMFGQMDDLVLGAEIARLAFQGEPGLLRVNP